MSGLIYVVLAALIKVLGSENHALLPAGGNGPDHYFHRLDFGSYAISNCAENWFLAFVALVIIIVCTYLGPWDGQDPSDSDWCHWLLYCGIAHGRSGFHRDQ